MRLSEQYIFDISCDLIKFDIEQDAGRRCNGRCRWSRNVRFPSRNCSVDELDHQYFLFEQRDLHPRINFQRIRCEFLFSFLIFFLLVFFPFSFLPSFLPFFLLTFTFYLRAWPTNVQQEYITEFYKFTPSSLTQKILFIIYDL